MLKDKDTITRGIQTTITSMDSGIPNENVASCFWGKLVLTIVTKKMIFNH
jgi:hypothetical protein